MKTKSLFFIVVLILPLLLKAQEEEKNFGIKFNGFVKGDYFYDTRQTVSAREGHFLLWPKEEKLDMNGKDINAVPNFNILAVQTRLKGTITGPDAFGAKTSGVIEGAFFGHTNADVNGFRLRHAFLKLKWENTELLAGQYWHPMFVTGCFPGTVSFNTGSPFQPFSRNPQIRLTHSIGKLKLIGAALSHRDFVSAVGVEGLRNSGMPDLNFQVHFDSKNEEANTAFLAGIGIEYKTIVPRLYNSTTMSSIDSVGFANDISDNDTNTVYMASSNDAGSYKVNESVNSYAAMAFTKIQLKPLTIKVEGVYGQNLYDLLMINSFAANGIADTTKNELTYTPTTLYSVWTDIHTNGKKIQAGIFAGYTATLGSEEFDVAPESGDFAGSRHNIANVMRIAPRIIFNSGKTRFTLEVEHTTAAFGDGTFDDNGIPQNTTTVSNTRFLVGMYYFF